MLRVISSAKLAQVVKGAFWSNIYRMCGVIYIFSVTFQTQRLPSSIGGFSVPFGGALDGANLLEKNNQRTIEVGFLYERLSPYFSLLMLYFYLPFLLALTIARGIETYLLRS